MTKPGVIAKIETAPSGLAREGGGLNRFDAATETFTHFRHDPNDPSSLSHDEIYALFLDRAGTLWIGTNSGVDVLDPDSGTFVRHYRHDPEHPTTTPPAQRRGSAAIQPFFEDDKGQIWFKGLNVDEFAYRFDPQTETFTHIAHDPFDPTSLRTQEPWTQLPERMGTLWMSTRRSTGLNYTDLQRGFVEHFQHDPENPNSLDNNLVWMIYSDRSGILWAGTNYALNRIDRTSNTVTRFSTTGGPRVVFMPEDQHGDFWVLRSGESGYVLNKWDRETNTFKPYSHAPQNPNSLSHDRVPSFRRIRPFLEDSEGTIWVGTNGGGLNRYDRATDSFVHYRHDPEDPLSLSSDTVSVLYEDHEGILWVGTGKRTKQGGGGLNQFDKETGTFTRFLNDPNNPHSLSSNEVTTLLEDRQGTLWIGTWGGGLNRFHRETKTFTNYAPLPEEPDAIRPMWVLLLLEDHTGQLWMKPNWGGLTRFNPTTGTFTPFTEQNSDLPSNIVNDVVEDDDGYLWISTNGSGLTRFDPETDTFRFYDTSRGFQSMEYNGGAAHKSASGELFFGGINGFNAFYPENLTDNEIPPQVALTGLRLFDESVGVDEEGPLKEYISIAEEISLAHNQNDLTFEYVGLHYSNPDANQYAYMLEPYEADWRYVGTQRTAIYPNLPSGNYVFHVKAANADGYWNEEATTIRVVILPPWWRTAWAYALYALLLIAAVAAANRLQRRRLLQKAHAQARIREAQLHAQNAQAQTQLLQQLDQTKSRFFANISHEFRTPLTLILGPLEDLLDGLHGAFSASASRQVSTAIDNGRRLLRLVNQLLDVSRLESGKIDLQAQELDMTAFVERLVRAFAPMAEHKHIAFRFEGPGQTLPVYVDAEQFEKVLANLLGNAFKFTPEKGTVLVTLTTDKAEGSPGSMVLSVRDNGPGIAPEHLPHLFERFYQADASSTRRQPGTGIGLALVKNLVELHHGTVEVESHVGLGTAFTVRLPLGHAHLDAEEIVAPDATRLAVDAASGDGLVLADEIRLEPVEVTEALAEERASEGDATTVLVVDDNPDVRAYVRRHLAQRYRVLEAADGRQALDLARECLPDLVVSDVMMPEMNGFGLCRAIKQDPELDFIPVILLTARASSESKIEGLEHGADDYLTKPFNVRELAVRVENLIASRQRLKARYAGSSNGSVEDSPRQPPAQSEKAEFMERVRREIAARLSEDDFGVEALASAVGLGRTTLYSRVRAAFGKPPMELIWALRLERAASLLRAQEGSVSEVAYGVGFKSVAHFCNRFRAQYGQTPAAYAAQHISDSA